MAYGTENIHKEQTLRHGEESIQMLKEVPYSIAIAPSMKH